MTLNQINPLDIAFVAILALFVISFIVAMLVSDRDEAARLARYAEMDASAARLAVRNRISREQAARDQAAADAAAAADRAHMDECAAASAESFLATDEFIVGMRANLASMQQQSAELREFFAQQEAQRAERNRVSALSFQADLLS